MMKFPKSRVLLVNVAFILGFSLGLAFHNRLFFLYNRILESTRPEKQIDEKLIGQRLPPIQLFDASGAEAKLDQAVDRKRIIFFWSTSCKYCKNLMGDLIDHEAALDGALINGINVDEDSVLANCYSQAKNYPWPFLRLIEGEEMAKVRSDYDLQKIPAIWFIDEQGIITKIKRGYSTWAEFIL